MRDYMRRVRFTPYRKGMGPTFTLTLWGDAGFRGDRWRMRYTLTMREHGKTVTLFDGDDFGPSPMHAHDSDESIAALMGFLTLRPGDTDREYFKDYTPAQLDYCARHAEWLSCEVAQRFGEG